jgi:hypothetical protein
MSARPTHGVSKPKSILSRITKYKAPKYPESEYIDRETWDYRKASGAPNPPTFVDAFICDIWQRITMDLKLEITEEEVTEEIVTQAMQVYLDRDWEKIAGYRPWTHWNFIRGLTPAERAKLATEVVAYIGANGVQDPVE